MMERIFVNFDKAGAEWVVVAYLSGDARMIDVVEKGKSPHLVTGTLISNAPEILVLREHELIKDNNNPYEIADLRARIPELSDPSFFLPRSMSIRQAAKKANHGLNYDEGYRVFALYNEITEDESKKIVDFYKTRAYPGIPVWHDSIRRELKTNHRTLTNCFGRKVVLRDVWDSHLFKAAYSFKPQSTVVDMVDRAFDLWYTCEARYMRDFDLKAQTHDSILAQFLITERKDTWIDLARCCITMDQWISPLCVYPPYEFTIRTDLKVGRDWGAMKDVAFPKEPETLALLLEEAVEGCRVMAA